MRKNCETCKHDDEDFSCYPHKMPCNECLHGKGCNDAPTKWEAAKHYKPDTNADRIRAMSDEELADWLARTQIANVAETLAVASIPYEPEDGLKDEVEKECLDWLKQPAEDATNENISNPQSGDANN